MKRYNLVNKEKQFIGRARYLPILFWYSTAANYLDGNISETQLAGTIIRSGQSLVKHKYKSVKINELLNELSHINPKVFKNIRKEIEL